MPFPQTLLANPKIVFFTDFDGTITLQDTNDYITAYYGCGHERLREISEQITWGNIPIRIGFQEEIDSWNMSLDDAINILKSHVTLDPYFKEFLVWAKSNDVPVVVMSSGMASLIRPLLQHLLGEELARDIEVVANDVQLRAPLNSYDLPSGWTVKYHDASDFGHNKSLEIRPYAEAIAQMDHLPEHEKPTLLYAGDGLSDISAARETDLLFAKAGKDLVTLCERDGIPFTSFQDWSSILQETQDIYHGRKSVRKIAQEGLVRHRRTSSLDAPPAGGAAALQQPFSASATEISAKI